MSGHIPKYRKHPNGSAFVFHKSIPTSDNRMYLGKYGTPESKKQYERFIAKLIAGESLAAPIVPKDIRIPSITDLIALYKPYAERYYSDEGKPTKEFGGMMAALGHLDFLHGNLAGMDYGPKLLKEVQRWLIAERYARGVVNNRIGRIKRFFRWCCEEELIPASVYHGLLSVSPAKKGRSDAYETGGVKPVPWELVKATLPYVSPQIAAMIQLQFFCGMRPQEVCDMRPSDIEREDDVWIYRPRKHKNAWRGKKLTKGIPRVAQEILAPFMERDEESHLFSPRESEAWRHEHRPNPYKTQRTTPVYPSEIRAKEKRRANRTTSSRLRTHYDTASYRRAIVYGHERARADGIEIPHWYPLQLRHSIASLVEKTLGRQKASRWLGHDHLSTTEMYVEVDVSELIQVANALDAHWER